MEKSEVFIIEGLAGQRSLSGEIEVGGAKNEVLKILASSILFDDEVSISAVPQIEDVFRMMEILTSLGITISKEEGEAVYHLITSGLSNSLIPPEISKKLRASIVLTGPLLSRLGEVSFPYPGGCVIGKRPIDLFLDGYKQMGATVREDNGMFYVSAPDKKLQGAEIFFKNQSVTATETFMMAAVLAQGKTVLKNCALEPEIVSLGDFLISAGAQISGLGTPTIEIIGGGLLSGKGKVHKTMPDRIEAGSFILLGALAAKDLKITNCEPNHLDSLLNLLRQSGVNFSLGPNFVRVFGNENRKFQAVDIKTHEYPGFPTDLQAPMSIFLTQTVGQSFVFETIYENRLNYLEALERFGSKARILDSHRAIIDGPTAFLGKEIESPDLRAGLAYVIAAIVAKGQSVVHNVYYIDRGYERVDERFRAIGVGIKRM